MQSASAIQFLLLMNNDFDSIYEFKEDLRLWNSDENLSHSEDLGNLRIFYSQWRKIF
jgi:hypothetical protein